MRSKQIKLLKLTKMVKDHSPLINSPHDTFELMIDLAKFNIEIMGDVVDMSKSITMVLEKLEEFVQNADEK